MLGAALAALLAIGAAATGARAQDESANGVVDQVALDAIWRVGPIVTVDGTYSFGLPERAAGTEGQPYKLPFAFRDGRPLELCALRGTLEARVFLDDLWVALGPIGPNTKAGPCVLLSGARVMVVNVSESGAVLGRATPK
jgi:hypothetical protein